MDFRTASCQAARQHNPTETRLPFSHRPAGRTARHVLAATLAVAALAAGAAACSTSSGPPQGQAAAAGSAAGASGTIGFVNIPPSGWDPVTSKAGSDVNTLTFAYATLVQLDASGAASPGLATAWSWSAGGKTLTLQLRKGVTFSDGTPFNAAAVVANINRAAFAADSEIAPELASVKSVTAVGGYQVAIHLSGLDYGLPLTLGGLPGMMVSPKAFAANASALATKPVGAGPFILTSYTPDNQATLVRNPDYYDASQIHVARLVLQFVSEAQSVLSSLESGQSQIAMIAGTQVKAAEAAGLKVAVVPSLHAYSLSLNNTISPLTNPDVAHAVGYALDRNALLQTVSGGIGQVDDEPFPPGYVGYAPSVAHYWYYDPAKARQLLAASGVQHPAVTITWLQGGGLGGQPEAEQIQAELDAVGFNAALREIPQAAAAEEVTVKHDVQFFPDGIAGRQSPVEELNNLYAADGLSNPSRDAAPAVTAALEGVAQYPLGSPQYVTALQAATAAGVMNSDDFVLFTAPWIFAYSPSVTGFQHMISAPSLNGVRLAS